MTKEEKEVIIRFDESSPTATLYTASSIWITKFNKLCKENPKQFKCVKTEYIGGTRKAEGKYYEFPKKFITIRSKEVKRTMSDEQRKASAERLKKARAKGKA